jgi:hypothetical protein
VDSGSEILNGMVELVGNLSDWRKLVSRNERSLNYCLFLLYTISELKYDL